MPRGKGLTKKQRVQVRTILKSNQELKYHNISGSQAVDSVGTVISLSNIAQGGGDQQRNGDKLMPTSIHAKFQMGRADATNLLRLIIFRWLAEDTTTVDPPTPAKLLQVSTAGAPFGQFNHDFRSKFQVLYDRFATTDQVRNDQHFWTWDKKLAKNAIQYRAATTDGKNKIYMLVITDSAAATHPTFNYDLRINYTDS